MKGLLILIGIITSFKTVHANCITGNCHYGEGVYISSKGDRYVGHFSNKKLHGIGSIEFRSGAKYEGEFNQGLYHGNGTYWFVNGDLYQGNWKNGKIHGEGTYTFSNGKVIKGIFKKGSLEKEYSSFNHPKKNNDDAIDQLKDCNQLYCHQTIGFYRYADGSVFKGTFKNGMPEGEGICSYANGDHYTGGWKNHAPHGNGRIEFASGRKVSAIWKNGKPSETLSDQIDFTPSVFKVKNTTDQKVRVFALIIGVASYHHMPSLKYTDDDAYRIYAFLKSPEGGALPDDQIKILIDDLATKNNILLSLENIAKETDENDVIMVYLSGHGLDGMFLPSDFDGYNNSIPFKEFKAILNVSKAKHKVVIADACHSGSMATARGSDYHASIHQYYKAIQQLDEGGTAFLLSSASNEVSLEYSGIRQGVFSHFLLQGLKGKADFDQNYIVTITELYHYIAEQVKLYTQNRQNPILSGEFNQSMPLATIRS